MILSTPLKLDKAMEQATSYAEWADAARAHDEATGEGGWRASDDSKWFDHRSIRRRLERLRDLRAAGDDAGLLYALNEGIHGNMDGMGNARLYRRARFGTKLLIEDYVAAIVEALEHLADSDDEAITVDEKLDFFRRAQHCYGRSAFLMSGAGSFLFFHLGVVKALWGEGLLPHILSGSSGGSVVGALIATRGDEAVPACFDPAWLANGTARALAAERDPNVRASTEEVYEEIAAKIPDLTFQEAFELTGRELNISVAPAEQHQRSRLLNAIASPNVLIREAVMASCAVPGVFPPVMLRARAKDGSKVPYLPARRWVDGSVSDDLPVKRLARLYGVNHHIVSQANPLVTPFALDIKQQEGPVAAIRNATVATWKAWLNANAQILQRPLSLVPALQSATNMALSVINQDYLGDINMIMPVRFRRLSKVLGLLDEREIRELMELGERTTWPNIEMVRTQTRISRTLERVLASYDAEQIAAEVEKEAA